MATKKGKMMLNYLLSNSLLPKVAYRIGIYYQIKDRLNNEKKLFDLRKYVSDKLRDLGVKVNHVNHDTFKEKDNFFSYRRSRKLKQKDYGRCISVIKMI